MTLKCEKIEHVFKPMELMFEGGGGRGGGGYTVYGDILESN